MSPSTKSEVTMQESKPVDENSDKKVTEKMMLKKVVDFIFPKGVYSGEMKNGKRHGYGIMKWNSGVVDECCWQDDSKHGLSIRTNTNGFVHWFGSIATEEESSKLPGSLVITKYPALWYPMISAKYKLGGNDDSILVNLANNWTLKADIIRNGLLEGKGMVENTEGKVMFEGEWKKGMIQFGSPLYFIFWAAWFVRYPLWYMLVVFSILFSMHSLLSGAHNRLSHMQVNKSTLFSDLPPSAQYSGQLSYFRRHGQGVMRYFDHSSFGNATLMREYNGSWSQGVMSGPGTLTFSLDAPSQRGDVLSGDWVDNRLPHGVYKYYTGEVYTGDLANFERHGTGTMRYVDGSVYEGQFRRGTREGRGKLTEVGDYVCEGEWRSDKFTAGGRCKRVDEIVKDFVVRVSKKGVAWLGSELIFFNRVPVPVVLAMVFTFLIVVPTMLFLLDACYAL